MDTLEKLVEMFKKFPGIGPRQARRFAYHLLAEDKKTIKDLSQLIDNLHTGIHICDTCFRFFSKKNPADAVPERCAICTDQNRDRSLLMILTQDTDISAVEQRKMYNGLYFVMGKNADLTSFDPASLPRLQELIKQIQGDQRNDLKEIILALNANTEGEHTSEIIRKALRDVSQNKFKITMLGRGLSTGTELEYSDAETIKSAIENRR